jgi:nitroreductase
MDIEEVLSKRKSCRNYDSFEIEQSDIDKILWAVERAPFASGGPRRRVTCITDKDTRGRLRISCFKQRYVAECSAVFVFSAVEMDRVLQSGYPKAVHDCGAGMMCADLMAVSLGFNTCWIGHFRPKEVKKIARTEGMPVLILLVGKAVRNED